MSNINLLDYLLKPNGEEDLIWDTEHPLNDDNPDLMSSDFFDSVSSLVDDSFNCDHDLDKELFLNDDSSDANGTESPKSTSSESGSSESSDQKDVFLSGNHSFEDVHDLDLTDTYGSDILNELPLSTQILINNSNPKKVIISKPRITSMGKGSAKTKQVFRVQSISGNKRPLLLPFNVANIKTIKIVNGNKFQAENVQFTSNTDAGIKTESIDYLSSSPDLEQDDSDAVESSRSSESGYPPLVLNEEEKRLLSKEGIQLPTHYPLTKTEERELKRIRRKIRNKISAQDSRKRKKEYVDGLEERIKRGADEKKFLLNRVKQLQKQNGKLMAQISKLQKLLFNTGSSKATPSTCLMIVLFSAMLVSLPNLHLSKNTDLEPQQQTAIRRALLFSEQATIEDDSNMEELLPLNKDEEIEFPEYIDGENRTDKLMESFGLKYEDYEEANKQFQNIKNTPQTEFKDFNKNDASYGKMAYDVGKNVHGYYEPDVDGLNNYGKTQLLGKRMREMEAEGMVHMKKLKTVPTGSSSSTISLNARKE